MAAETDALEPLGSARAALFEVRAVFGNRGGQPLGGPLLGHADHADDVAISPDGLIVALASADQDNIGQR